MQVAQLAVVAPVVVVAGVGQWRSFVLVVPFFGVRVVVGWLGSLVVVDQLPILVAGVESFLLQSFFLPQVRAALMPKWSSATMGLLFSPLPFLRQNKCHYCDSTYLILLSCHRHHPHHHPPSPTPPLIPNISPKNSSWLNMLPSIPSLLLHLLRPHSTINLPPPRCKFQT